MSNDSLPEIDLLMVGHVAADVVPHGFILGGTVAYAAATAFPFGLRLGVLTSAREDEPLLDELSRIAHVVNIPAKKTTSFNNIYTPAGRIQYWPASAARIAAADVPEAWRSTPLVFIAPLADEIDADLIDVFSPAAKVMLTPQGWMRRRDEDERVRFKPWFDANILQRADFVVISEEDIAEAPEMRNRYAAATHTLVVTNGEKGGTYYVDNQMRSYEAVPVEIEDLTGAGDVFATTAFIAWDRLDHDVDAAMKVAAYLSSCSITRLGLDGAPTGDEIDAAFARLS